MLHDAPPLRVWEIFPSRNVFLCRGKIILGSSPTTFVVTNTLITAAFLACLILQGPWFYWYFGIWVPLFMVLYYIWTMFILWKAAGTDPGIIPRVSPHHKRNELVATSVELFPFAPAKPPQQLSVLLNGVYENLAYCRTCNIYRPPRASHCSYCDNCVEVFDHHCPWVGQCIAKRNYRYFVAFLYTLSFAMVLGYLFAFIQLWMVISTAQSMMSNGQDNSAIMLRVIFEGWPAIVEGFFSFILMFSIWGMAMFHTYLIIVGQTTNESIKRTNRHRSCMESLEDMGRNVVNFICHEIEPSRIHFREVHRDDWGLPLRAPRSVFHNLNTQWLEMMPWLNENDSIEEWNKEKNQRM